MPDVGAAVADGKSVVDAMSSAEQKAFLADSFISTVQQRGAAVIGKRGSSSAFSAANAVVDHLRSWFLGTPAGTHVSMAVPSDGSYNIPKGLVFSYPVTIANGEW